MIENIGEYQQGEGKNFMKLSTILGTQLVDDMSVSAEDFRYDCYQELLNGIARTMKVGDNNFSQIFDEFTAYCQELRPQAEVVHIDLNGLSSKEELLGFLQLRLGLDGEVENVTDISEMLGKKFMKNFRSGIYIFTGKPAISEEEDYLSEWFSPLKISAPDEKLYYLGTDMGEVTYRSEYLGERRPIFLK